MKWQNQMMVVLLRVWIDVTKVACAILSGNIMRPKMCHIVVQMAMNGRKRGKLKHSIVATMQFLSSGAYFFEPFFFTKIRF